MGFVLDVAGYGARSAPLQNEVQRRLPPLVINTLAECGMDLDYVEHEWTGDGINAVMPADMDPTVVLPVLIRSLAANLGADNARGADRIRLRMAIGVGLVEHSRTGFGGPMIIDINRLVDCAPLRAALSAYQAADLAVAISDQVHATVIRPGYPGIPEAQFNRVDVVEKEFAAPAWIWVSARQWSTHPYQRLAQGDPRAIGGYRVGARLGGGPSGQVFLCCARDSDWLAIKVYGHEFAADMDVSSRLNAGVRAARVPRGPHIAQVADADTGSPRPWVATRLVEGPSLAAAVTETGPLPAASVAWLILGLARAIATLHEAGLAHQAITPANVLLEADGPVLTDLGLSRVALTDGSAVATDDVFMLGCVTCYAATGRAPWSGSYPAGAVLAAETLGAPDLAGCPPALLPVMGPCLNPDPGLRPTAAGLLARLTEIVGQPPRSWLPAAVAARFAAYRDFPMLPPAHRARLRLRKVLARGGEPPADR
jgi:hypothetical protein